MAGYTGPVKLPPDFDLQGKNAATEWKFWKTAFEDYLLATVQSESADKVKLSILRNIIGTESARIMSTFVIPEVEPDKYNFTIAVIDKYVNPRVNECFERYNFLKRVQKEGESFEHFLTECKHFVRTCNYNDVDPNQTAEDKALRDKIVMGIRDSVTRETLLRIEKLTLGKAIEFCRTSEQSKHQNMQFQDNAGSDIDFVTKFNPKRQSVSDKHKFERQDNRKSKFNSGDKFKCTRCQLTHGARECPAFGKKCKKCGILNHFAVSCRVKNVKSVDPENNSDSSSDIFIRNVNKACSCTNRDCIHRNIWDEIVEIENKKVKLKLDTGADISIIPEKSFERVNKQFKVRHTDYIVKGFEGTKAKTVGIVNLFCKFKNRSIYEDFVIVKGATRILLSGQACVDLGLVKRINKIDKIDANSHGSSPDLDKDSFINKNSDIFSGHGRFSGKFKITTIANFEAVSYPPTKIPRAIRDSLKNELDRLVERKAIFKINEIDPRASINRMVIIEKPNGKLRLCLDPSDLNKQIVRKPRAVSTIEEICASIIGKKIFTVFDLAEGYHHLELDEDSSWKCCFSTPFGIYRYAVLPYGL